MVPKPKTGVPKQMFLGWMAYARLWAYHDRHAITIGGGEMNNPGRYLTLVPAINGATATTGTPYYTENANDRGADARHDVHLRLHAFSVHHLPA